MQLDMDFWCARPPGKLCKHELDFSRTLEVQCFRGWWCHMCCPSVCVGVCVGVVRVGVVGFGGRWWSWRSWRWLDMCWTFVGLLLDFCWTFAGLLLDFCWTNEAECLHYGLKTLFSVGDDGGADDGDSAFFSPIALVQNSKCLVHRSGQSTDNLNPSGAREQGTGHGSEHGCKSSVTHGEGRRCIKAQS